MKVAFYSISAENLYRFRLPVARRLEEAGYHILFISPDDPYTDGLEASGFECVRFDGATRGISPFGQLRAGFRLAEVYRAQNPDIVHHFGLEAIVHGGRAARSAGMPWVVHAVPRLANGASRSKWLRPGGRWILRRSMRGAEVTIQAPEDREFLIAKGCVRPERAHLIGGDVVDPERIPYQSEPDRPPVAAFIGDIEALADLEAFVESARRLRAAGKVPQARFAIIGGDFGLRDDVRDRLEKWQEEGIAEWWPRREVDASLRNVHVIYTPSCREYQLRSTLLTAAAMGRPVVATEHHGCRALIRDGETGMLVPPQNVDALSAAFDQLLSNTDRRREMGRSARSFVEDEYAAKHMAKQMMAVYQRLFEHGREI